LTPAEPPAAQSDVVPRGVADTGAARLLLAQSLAQLARMLLPTFIQRQIGSTRVLMGISPGRVAVSGEIEFWQIC
jgi:hypothetical protein